MATAVGSRYAGLESGGGSTGNQSVNSAGGTITTTSSPQTTSQTGTSSSSSQETIENFDPQTKSALDILIQQLLGGGTAEQKKNNKQRQALMSFVEQMLGEYSKKSAFDDAQNLMNLNIQQTMQKNMPAISRAIEGAGTSASSMQGLLSQNLARDAALGAGALGAEQAKSYANASVNLASVLENLSRPDNSIVGALTNALQIAKGGIVNRTINQTGSTSQNASQSGRTEVKTIEPSGQVGSGGNTPYAGNPSSGNTLLDWAKSVGYTGDLRPFTSLGDSGQSLSQYTSEARGFDNPMFAIVGNGENDG